MDFIKIMKWLIGIFAGFFFVFICWTNLFICGAAMLIGGLILVMAGIRYWEHEFNVR